MKDAVLDTNQGSPTDQPGPQPSDSAPRPRKRTDWWSEVKGLFWLLLIVLGFHSFIAKPFYIPSESMLPGLRVGDRLVVSKFAYGWSFVSPTIPNPVAIFKSVVLHQPTDSWSFQLPFIHGRLFGSLPTRGDVVIVTPPGTHNDYIKRVIGLPGDRLEVRDGTVILNGQPVKRGPLHYVDIPVDTNSPCNASDYGDGAKVRLASGQWVCHLPIVTETLPNNRRYDTVELGWSPGDNYGPITIPANHVFLMGDNRDRSADSRFSLAELGLGGAVPYENIGGRAEFVTFSLDGDATLNPLTWWGSLRSGRAGTSLHPAKAD
ncbi:signal peptidase I [Sphingomonas sp. NCPPB 2930]|uniref:signal peptidase I n=1 Tax=unclassified Sphingomonas TaxID=196159 RepID=UPI00285BFDB9|nr:MULTISPECIES: signal peptidase I [unclassified Sphingomonas]MDR6114387.1 signal peptidase I [Sphingomonas sp. SORGH_AS_0789]MDR6144438.1 signal peptidase I [Sphingomonas sp. SORGH_AS_0870]MDR6148253.1 signal peptidase I [Sphingomonas sp. SORGH_AS_0742]